MHVESRSHRSPIGRRWPGVALLAAILCGGGVLGHAEEPDAAVSEVATFGAWELYCSDDAANSLRRCHIEQDDILVVGIRHRDGTGLRAVEVSGDPPMAGSKVTFQVDGGLAMSWLPEGDSEGSSAELIAEMQHGQRIEASYLSFDGNPLEFRPDQAGRSASASLDGFAAALAEMEKRLDAYKGG